MGGFALLRVRREMVEALLFASTLASMVRFSSVTDFFTIAFFRIRE
jgi:hypothetical protein